jgi:ankyrin repeat protein
MLLEANASLDARDVSGRTPIHLAASRGHVAVLEVLLTHPKCDIYTEDKQGNTPLHVAAR